VRVCVDDGAGRPIDEQSRASSGTLHVPGGRPSHAKRFEKCKLAQVRSNFDFLHKRFHVNSKYSCMLLIVVVIGRLSLSISYHPQISRKIEIFNVYTGTPLQLPIELWYRLKLLLASY
jgi:hypothetical protein